ncbi:protein mono-ADP-ribosyltransferase PARP12 [Xyrichtys novacula]|uniref:Protein mono-ADP-ribosyltransferase PARP12 n=1 Tax=Xyrichtys novacula TaxID=13765 RepID=A0AAV1F0Z8_XYRNO|nr:protein mono-ADP-ribosyltransferase PARP12 [Xyrichtys novacula]
MKLSYRPELIRRCPPQPQSCLDVEVNRMGDKTMETEILKIICCNQGAVDTKFLISNLGLGDSTSEILNNPEKFAFCCPYGQPKVVARTSLRLCRPKVCPGSCQSLHLCKSLLLNGSCQFALMR